MLGRSFGEKLRAEQAKTVAPRSAITTRGPLVRSSFGHTGTATATIKQKTQQSNIAQKTRSSSDVQAQVRGQSGENQKPKLFGLKTRAAAALTGDARVKQLEKSLKNWKIGLGVTSGVLGFIALVLILMLLSCKSDVAAAGDLLNE